MVDGNVQYSTMSFVGTSSYQPPELNASSKMLYNPAAFDVWSLGVILFFITGIEGLAAMGSDFTFMSKVRRRDEPKYRLLDQKRSDGKVPDNAKFWDYFGATLKVPSKKKEGRRRTKQEEEGRKRKKIESKTSKK